MKSIHVIYMCNHIPTNMLNSDSMVQQFFEDHDFRPDTKVSTFRAKRSCYECRGDCDQYNVP